MTKIIKYLFLLLPITSLGQVINKRSTIVEEDSPSKTGTTYAVVIGISNYQNVTKLNYADKDARSFADYLLSQNGIALDSDNVKVFLNENATLNNIGNALSDIYIKNLKKGDRIIFFFAGHGDYDAKILKDQALLLLYGAPKNNYFQNIFKGDFISTADLNSRFIDPVTKKGGEVLLIIDACHATGLNQNLSGGVEGGKVTTQALENMTSAIKIYSCKANQYSLESKQWGGGHGLFSYVLLEGLYGMANNNADKIVTLRELQRYLEDNVPSLAAPNKQDPIVKIENGDEPIAKINEAFLTSYKAQKNKTLTFIAKADTKGGNEDWLLNMNESQRQLYKACDSLIKLEQLDYAYQTYSLFKKKDSISDASLQLKRNLSAALQQKTANILNPMLEDVNKFNSNLDNIKQAAYDLKDAAELLGTKHFLYKNLQARILFLFALEKIIALDTTNLPLLIKNLEQSIVFEPNAPYSYFYLGELYYYHGDYEKSKLNYEKYINLIPGSSWAYNNVGIVYNLTGKYQDAIKKFQKAKEIDASFWNSYYNLASAYKNIRQYDSAVVNYKKTISLKPDFPGAYTNLGNLYATLEEYNDAIVVYKKAIKVDPDFSLAYFGLGNVYYELKNYDLALTNYKTTVGLNPDLGIAYYYIACIYSLQKQAVSSLDYLESAILHKFGRLDIIQKDPNLQYVRQFADFNDLINKYFRK